jgi:hypothetical protein
VFGLLDSGQHGGLHEVDAGAKPQPMDVEVVEMEQKDVPIYGQWIGTLDGFVNAKVKAQVTGYLFRQDCKEGTFVKKGPRNHDCL